jgi:hypothetical protein
VTFFYTKNLNINSKKCNFMTFMKKDNNERHTSVSS